MYAATKPIGLLATLLALTPLAAAQNQPASGKEIYQKVLHSTALVVAPAANERVSQGTGWLIDKQKKHVITNQHVVGSAERVIIVFPVYKDGQAVAEREFYSRSAPRIAGRVLATDVKRDLALIEIDSVPNDVVEVKMAAQPPSPGDNVHAVGNPSASDALWVYTSGTVRQVYRKKITQEGETFDAKIIETQAPLNPGDSGGPVVNDQGELVGVSRAIRVGVQLVSICVDVSEVKDFVGQPRANRSVAEAPKAVDTTELRKRAADALKRGQHDVAILGYTEALKLDPRNAEALAGRGDALWHKGDYVKAVTDFDGALKLSPTDHVVLNNRGRALLGRGEHDKALADFSEALRLQRGRYPSALRNRAFVLAIKGDLEKALEDAEQSIKLNAKDPLALVTRAYVRAKQNDLAKALADLGEARKLQAALPATYLDDWKVAARLHPDDAAINAWCSHVAMTRQNPEVATLHGSAALKLDPANVIALLAKAEVHLQNKEYDKAIEDCTALVASQPTLAEPLELRLRAYSEKGEKELADKDRDEVAKLRGKPV